MMQLELYDVMFLFTSLKGPTDAFNIYDYVTFHTGSAHSTHLKLKHVLSRTNSTRHFYFNRMPRLWNSLPTVDLEQSTVSINRFSGSSGIILFAVLSLTVHVCITACALALNAHVYLWCIILMKCFIFWPLGSSDGPSVHLPLSSPQHPSPLYSVL